MLETFSKASLFCADTPIPARHTSSNKEVAVISFPALCICIIAGILPLVWLADIPSLSGIIMLLAVALCLLAPGKQALRYPVIILLSLCWGLLSARQSLAPFEVWLQKPVTADVVIVRTDGEKNHELRLLKGPEGYLFPPAGVVLRNVYLPGPVCSGQKWQMKLRLQPVHGQLNEGGFDSQRYALAQHLPLRGRVIEAKQLSEQCSLRARWMDAVQKNTQSLPWGGIIEALAFGERSNITSEAKDILRKTGTAHLMAISGLHISLAAGIGWLMARLFQLALPAHRISFRMPLIASLLTAGVYTWLAGCNPPAVRAILALAIWLSLRIQGRQWTGWEVWLACVTGILFFDPLTVLSDSFWLSALAVASLIFWYQWMPLPRGVVQWPWYYRYPTGLLHLQIGITLLLMPLQIFIFHGISVNALAANLVAVPFISFIVTPLLLAGLMFTGIPWLGETWWKIVDALLAQLFRVLDLIPGGWQEVDQRFQLLSLTGWVAIVIYRMAWWRTSAASVAVLAIALLLVTTRTLNKNGGSGWAIVMLDVGHGLSVALVRNNKVMLYDTGNAWPGGDAAQQTIIPWLRWHNLKLEGVILSHEHLDHRGGLTSLQKAWPELPVRSPLLWEKHRPCFAGEKWQWQGLEFAAIWPPAKGRAAGNNGSCVVMVSDGHHKLLLTGDIEAQAELAMLKNRWGAVQADIVQVPHHGSRTSSTDPLLRAVSGKAALASVSRYNAWRLPSVKTIERYKKHGYRWFDTAHSGQITIRINRDKWQIHGFREQIMPRWYHQWFGVTKDNG